MRASAVRAGPRMRTTTARSLTFRPVFSPSRKARRRSVTVGVFAPPTRAELSVYTLPNAEHESARSYLARHLRSEFKNLDYHRVSDRFFAVSGIVRGKTFYSRCNYESPRGAMHCIYLAYPAAENRAWDSVVTRISRSLRGTISSGSR